jgi:alpha-galactosidase
LTPEKERRWQQWIRIYRDHMLSRGQYVGGLYDIGFDKPETHVIRKGNTLYYAFFAPHFAGPVTLRGLPPGKYSVVDYVRNKPLGNVEGPQGELKVQFEKSLLVEASRIQ